MVDARVPGLAAAAEAGSSPLERADGLIRRLRWSSPIDAAWLALVDPLDGSYRTLSVDLDGDVESYLAGPLMSADMEATQINGARVPLSPSDLAYPADDLQTWAECLIPAGFHEARAVALYTPDRRHVGFLAVLSQISGPSEPHTPHPLDGLVSAIAQGIDPLRTLAVSSRAVEAACAGVTLWRDGSGRPLPGLAGDPLLDVGSGLVGVARTHLTEGEVFSSSFLWPRGGTDAPDDHVRVTVLASSAETGVGLLGAIVLAPVNDVHGLTPRELEVLGLVVEGLSNHQIARSLVVSPRTVATHLEHILAKLDCPTRTLAAVRAQRLGLYVPRAEDVADD